jgi:hypothetical protein
MSFLSRFKESRETKREEKLGRRAISAEKKVKQQGRRLATAGRERYAASLGEKGRAFTKEAWEKNHPKTVKFLQRAEQTGTRTVQFGERIAKEGAGSYAKTGRTLRRTNVRVRQGRQMRQIRPSGPSRRSFASPSGEDTSLSGGIVRNDWAGNRNLMDREFFNSTIQVPQGERDLLGTQSQAGKELVSSGNSEKKSKVRYY